jgi:hypothetical protein
MNRAHPWAIVFVILNVIDLVLTLQILATGAGSEGNPVMAWIFEGGPLYALFYKLIFPWLLAALLVDYSSRHIRGIVILKVLVIAWVIICLFNLGVLILI